MRDCQELNRLSGVFIDGTFRLGVLVGFHHEILRLESHLVETGKKSAIASSPSALTFATISDTDSSISRGQAGLLYRGLQFRGRILIFP